ncbi:MAG: ABC transporter ATP-binding protein [Bacteroidetes bacterium]|nr:ABC transporter ATP-binding protein [Bacteroidota bacterium]
MSIKNKITNAFLVQLLQRIKNELPHYVVKSIYRTIHVSFILSLIEILSLTSLFPLINIILNPAKIQQNTLTREIFHLFNFKNDFTFILTMLVFIILVFIAKNVAVYFLSKYQINIFYKTAENLVLEKYRNYMNMPYSEHTDSNSSSLLRNTLQIPYEFTNNILMPFGAIINELIIITLLAVSIALYSPGIFLSLTCILFPLVYYYNWSHKKTLQRISEKRDEETLNLYRQISQSFEGIREFIVFDKKNFFYKSLRKSASNFTEISSESFLISHISPKVIETLAVFALFIVFLSGFIQGKPIEDIASVLIMYAVALYKLIPSINKILLSLNNIRVADYTFNYLKKQTASEQPPNEAPIVLAFAKEINIKDLDFYYSGSEKLVLSNINLKIQKGSKIGIIGPSGSGKSTLLNILLRLFNETAGGIYIDNTKITAENVKALYQIIGYVPQNITIIEGTLLENVAFGIDKNFIDMDLFKTVIEKSQLSVFLNELPQGPHTQLGERGVKISGGQKQRIGIARALYHKAQILIFDEATSALDYETEKMLTESISAFSGKDITVIIVAHRLQTLKYCDCVYKLENGRLDPRPFKYEEIFSEKP